MTVTYSAMVAVAAKEMSIPPEINTKRTPVARIPMNALLFSRSKAFSSVKKFGLILVMMRLKMMMMART
jgi:hypothetical protein